MDLSTNQLNEYLFVDFNQDTSCFVVATETGYRVFQTDPLHHTYSRAFEGAGGLGCVSMLFRSNVMALVGGGRNPRYPPTKVVLWDDKDCRAIAELTFRTNVRTVKLRRDLVVVGVESKVFVYRFSDLALVDNNDTTSHELGELVSCSGGPERVVVASPGNVVGKLNIVFYDPSLVGSTRSLPEQPANRRIKTTTVMAHESALAVVALNFDGTRVATASVKGTLIRVFDTTTGDRLFELRRGAEKVDIYSIAFNVNSDWLAVSSDKGTIHVFSLRTSDMNKKSSLSALSTVLPSYFQSQWSFAQFRVPDYRTICCFGSDPNTVICLCADGSYYRAKFDPILGGEMTRVRYERIDSITS